MEREPRMWRAADFECRNKAVDELQRKSLFSNKPIGVCYNTLKKTSFGNLILEKHGYNKNLGEDCVKWFV